MHSKEKEAYEELKEKMEDQKWRLNHLYWITNKQGRKVKFKLNYAQDKLYDSLWYLNIILKARQLGMSTFINILFLDWTLFNSNKNAGIICDTLTNAKAFLKKIKFAYDSLPGWLKERRKITRYSLAADDAGMTFDNGSSINVGTSFRSGTLQYLHISEHAKICAKSPEKASEIRAGALNTVQVGQIIFIESTAEGSSGDFYDWVKQAEDKCKAETKLSKLDFRLHFFDWWNNPEYELESDNEVFSTESMKYFGDLEGRGIKLSNKQKNWYIKKKEMLSDDIKKEYPSFPEEAFEATDDAKYFKNEMNRARTEKRICEFNVDKNLKVHTWWDLGINDYMSIWFVQIFGKEVRIIDFLEGSGEGLGFYKRQLDEKGYDYGKHYAPHDIMVRELGTGNSRYEAAKNIGINFEVRSDGKKIVSLVPNLSFEDGIDAVRRILPNCWFRESTTKIGVEHLERYAKKWNESLGQFIGALHNEHSHAADAFRYMAVTNIAVESESSKVLEYMKERRMKRSFEKIDKRLNRTLHS